MNDDYELSNIPEQDVKQLIRTSIKNLNKAEITDFIYNLLLTADGLITNQEMVDLIHKCDPNEL